MPYAENNGVRIHYRVIGTGKPLVLHHGFTESIEDWLECGYVDALQCQHRLILMDARGHGRSDKPHDPVVYSLETRVRDVVAVLDAIGIKRAHYWGYSMGGWVGFGMAQFAPERVDQLVIGGQHPFARSMEHLRQMVRAGIDGGTDAFVAAFHKTFGPAEGRLQNDFAPPICTRISPSHRTGPLSMNCCRKCRRLAASTLAMQMTYSGRRDRQASEFRVQCSFPSRGSIIARPSEELSLCCPGSCRFCWEVSTSEDFASCGWPKLRKGRTLPLDLGPTNGRFRRNLVPAHFGEGPLTIRFADLRRVYHGMHPRHGGPPARRRRSPPHDLSRHEREPLDRGDCPDARGFVIDAEAPADLVPGHIVDNTRLEQAPAPSRLRAPLRARSASRRSAT